MKSVQFLLVKSRGSGNHHGDGREHFFPMNATLSPLLTHSTTRMDCFDAMKYCASAMFDSIDYQQSRMKTAQEVFMRSPFFANNPISSSFGSEQAIDSFFCTQNIQQEKTITPNHKHNDRYTQNHIHTSTTQEKNLQKGESKQSM